MTKLRRLTIALLLSGAAYASSPFDSQNLANTIDLPWMTGPLLANPGVSVPVGHVNIEPYFIFVDTIGNYTSGGRVVRNPASITLEPLLAITTGVLPNTDIEADIPYRFNMREGRSDNHWGDIVLILGYHAMNSDPKNNWKPDVRFTLQETFPSGRYNRLNPVRLGTDATGGGTYQTAFGINFQKTWHLSGEHFLRTELNYSYGISTDISVSGASIFGGNAQTSGTVSGGNASAIDIGLEYSLNRHWVLATDLVYNNLTPSIFTGSPGKDINGNPIFVGDGSNHQYAITPSIEYNWSANLGLIVGAWLSVAGDNSSDFDGAMIALNWYI